MGVTVTSVGDDFELFLQPLLHNLGERTCGRHMGKGVAEDMQTAHVVGGMLGISSITNGKGEGGKINFLSRNIGVKGNLFVHEEEREAWLNQVEGASAAKRRATTFSFMQHPHWNAR